MSVTSAWMLRVMDDDVIHEPGGSPQDPAALTTHAVRLLVITRDGAEVVPGDDHETFGDALFAALEMVLRWSSGQGSGSLASVARRALEERDEALAATVVDLWNAQQRRPRRDGSATVWVLAPGRRAGPETDGGSHGVHATS